ncbi:MULTISPECIES: hypothetical protein [Paenibacillus]|uniref:Uncharacterized protein n=1 Tax=Paenibacillus amylolyticus TaxID=1451 RepID=A0ABD8B2E0_PAEAM|nr:MULTISPECIES: hypothetical protein [unclassified Paenibacillus]PJN64618.1 hypothetical protein PAEAM_07040 [Paenibacillus sp. GM1FR]SDD49312.1 hypothetical protein SAMN05428987_4966 [Paenibacillus sp. CF095]
MRKIITTFLSIGFLVSSISSAASAEIDVNKQHKNENENISNIQVDTKVNNRTSSNSTVSLAQSMVYSTSFSLTSVYESSWFQVSNTGEVSIWIHQKTVDPKYNPLVQYKLIGSGANGFEQSIYVSGTFTDQNTIRSFNNIPAGTYRIQVINYGGVSKIQGDLRLYN